MMIGTVTICVLIWYAIFVPVSSRTRKLTLRRNSWEVERCNQILTPLYPLRIYVASLMYGMESA